MFLQSLLPRSGGSRRGGKPKSGSTVQNDTFTLRPSPKQNQSGSAKLVGLQTLAQQYYTVPGMEGMAFRKCLVAEAHDIDVETT
jgi:hypothetical protein